MKLIISFFFLTLSALALTAQTASNEPWPFPDRRRPDDESRFVKEMLAKQQTAREKKDYENLLERGEAALKLSDELQQSLEENNRLSETERKKLDEFEKLLSKIRDDLGGDDDGEIQFGASDEDPPKDVREGLLFLKRSTEQLVCEIKRSTRFSVSILAIESSNSLIRLARFLRLKN